MTFNQATTKYLSGDGSFQSIPSDLTGTNAFYTFNGSSVPTATSSIANKKCVFGFGATNALDFYIFFDQPNTTYLSGDGTFRSIPSGLSGTNAFYTFNGSSVPTATSSTANKKCLFGFGSTNALDFYVFFDQPNSTYLAGDGTF